MNELQSHAADALNQMGDDFYNSAPSGGMSQISPEQAAELQQMVQPPASIAAPVQPQVQTSNPSHDPAFGPGPANPDSEYHVPPPELTPRDILGLDVQQRAGERAAQQQANTEILKGTEQQTAVDTQKAAAESHAHEMYNNAMFGSAERERMAQNIHQADVETTMQRQAAAVKEQTEYANAIPTDVWGASGVNKIAGIIGLILGSIGGAATGGKNMAVEAMNNLADQNIKRMKLHYDMLGDKVKGYDNVYSKLREKLGDAHAAELGTRQVLNDSLINSLKQADLSVVGAQGKAKIQQAIGELAQQSHVLGIAQDDRTMKAVGTAATLGNDLYKAQLTHAEHRENIGLQRKAEKEGISINHFHVTRPDLAVDKAQADKLREHLGGVAQVETTVQNLKDLYKQPDSVEKTAKISQLTHSLLLNVIEAKGLSKRVSGGEGKLIEQQIGALSQGLTGLGVQRFAPDLADRVLDSFSDNVKSSYISAMRANGYEPDPNDEWFKGNAAAGPNVPQEESVGGKTRDEIAREKASTTSVPSAYQSAMGGF